jgi:hypothetical protein
MLIFVNYIILICSNIAIRQAAGNYWVAVRCRTFLYLLRYDHLGLRYAGTNYIAAMPVSFNLLKLKGTFNLTVNAGLKEFLLQNALSSLR